jgi:hypothetical protein
MARRCGFGVNAGWGSPVSSRGTSPRITKLLKASKKAKKRSKVIAKVTVSDSGGASENAKQKIGLRK